MTDKEVGELWLRDTCSKQEKDWLIRKLIEERANSYQQQDRTAPTFQDKIFPKYRNFALRDFGIDPKTFTED